MSIVHVIAVYSHLQDYGTYTLYWYNVVSTLIISPGVHEDQRNGINATVRCETDILKAVIIWYVGNKRSVPDKIALNGRSATATETIPVAETIQVICIAQNRSTSENDTLTLHPREGLCRIYVH